MYKIIVVRRIRPQTSFIMLRLGRDADTLKISIADPNFEVKTLVTEPLKAIANAITNTLTFYVIIGTILN